MEKIVLYEHPRYHWDCPECGNYNETDEDILGDLVECESCGEEFEVGDIF